MNEKTESEVRTDEVRSGIETRHRKNIKKERFFHNKLLDLVIPFQITTKEKGILRALSLP